MSWVRLNDINLKKNYEINEENNCFFVKNKIYIRCALFSYLVYLTRTGAKT